MKRTHVPPNLKGKGRFRLGDIVEWRASSKGAEHCGEIVEVVKYGLYPTVSRHEHIILKTRKLVRSDIDWPELNSAAYYREHESYVAEDVTGRRWWPRVGNLRLVDIT